ncbi:hypothetical protein HPK19_19565 [Arthrobacter citreus]|nr:hypothetical protein HPK19_19565 [Arthrobacter citreus]
MHKLLKIWIRIPRLVKQTFLSSIVLIFVIYWGVLGSKELIHLFNNINLLKIIIFILSLIIATLLYWMLKDEMNTNKK